MHLPATLTLSALMFLGATNQLFGELFMVVRITDLRGNAEFQLCTEADVRKIESELNAEARALPKVIEKSKTEWNLAHSEAAFPSARVKPRTFKVMNTAINREEAGKLLAQAKIHEGHSLAKEKEEERDILKTPPFGHGRANRAAVVEQKQQVREERERDEIADKAEVIVRKNLSAAVGHEIPFYGTVPEEPKKAGKRKK